MRNILLVTNIYPNNDPQYGGTAVCHSFTTEWVKMGYTLKCETTWHKIIGLVSYLDA